ncbi:hypothetical protein E2K80_13890 [Rhodophyticola sp. CCM32]|uniref:hypothetical protein n=1 Tax=Rhodophyticola sp. CCM32 TaxID=2916397 RepID=UPI00107F488E|nr:hypothetical protein [Rhodophyticola sp. CCM32]QBY01682.1 hypothetical protein E2K80_13890 [Rhodophyticola sp. CCM32]
MMAEVGLHLCATCNPEGFSDAYDSLQAALDACAEPIGLALKSQGRATYLFAARNPMADRTDIVAPLVAYSGHRRSDHTTICPQSLPIGVNARDRLKLRVEIR